LIFTSVLEEPGASIVRVEEQQGTVEQSRAVVCCWLSNMEKLSWFHPKSRRQAENCYYAQFSTVYSSTLIMEQHVPLKY
jgi:hypothetical protein